MKKQRAYLLVWTTSLALALLVLGVGLPVASATHELPALVAWWKLDEPSGTTAFDETANNNDGTLCGNNLLCTPPGGPTVGAAGHFGTAYSFDGVDDYVSVPNAVALNPVTAYTLAAWVRYDGTLDGATHTIFSKSSFVLNKRTNETLGCTHQLADNSFSRAIVPAGAWSLNTYHHLACTWDGSAVRIYLDGLLRNGNGAATLKATTSAVTFGGDPVGANFFPGRLDDVRIYSSALSASQVEDLFLDPEHHACSTEDQEALTNWVEPFTSSIAGPLLTWIVVFTLLAVILGAGLFKLKGGASVLIIVAMSGTPLLLAEPVSASHDCVVLNSVTAASVAQILVPLAFLFAIVGVVIGAVALALRNRKGY